MQGAVQKVSDLINHLREESLNEHKRCFYCRGPHKTADCDSSQRAAFHLSLAAFAAETRDMGFEQESPQYGNKPCTDQTHSLNLEENWEELAF